jgi:bifunctional non-homologous end joining protein LigD
MLLWATDRLPDGDEWWSELKLDGCRGQLRVADGNVELRSRPGRRCEREFPEVAAAAAAHPALSDAVLDGELVRFDANGHPDFHALRERLGTSERAAAALARVRPVRFVIFDVMWLDEQDLRPRPFTERRRRLEALDLRGDALQPIVSAPGCADVMVQFAREHQLEGVVAKRGSSPYASGRSRTWLKHKLHRSELVWVTAWTPGECGEPDRYWVARELDGRLRLCGEVSFGLAPDQRARLRREVARREIGSARRGGLRPIKLGVRLRVQAHGRPDGPLRDPMIRSVELPARPRAAA